MRFRWRLVTDAADYDQGWWLDDVSVYTCESANPTVDVTIGGNLKGSYPMLTNGYKLVQYAVEGGPVVVSSDNGANIVASLFQLRRPASTGGWTGIAHLMGIPQEQLSDTYVFPYFDATTSNMYNVFTIGNVDTKSTTVSVKIAGVLYDTYTLDPSEALVVRPPLKGGPIVIQSNNDAKLSPNFTSSKEMQPPARITVNPR